MSSSRFPYTSTTIPKMDCNKEFCLLMYKSHKDTLTKYQQLEQQHATLQLRNTQLMNHCISSGTVTKTNTYVTATGEQVTPEMFLQRMRMFEQNRAAMERMHKESEVLKAELAKVKAHADKKAQQARELEHRLNSFARPQTYTFTDEQHRAAVVTNEQFQERIYKLERENRHLKSQTKELIHRTAFVPCTTVGTDVPVNSNLVPLTCPYGGCSNYSDIILGSSNPVKQLQMHIIKHRVSPTHILFLILSISHQPHARSVSTASSWCTA